MNTSVSQRSSCEHVRRLATGKSIVGGMRDGLGQLASFGKIMYRFVHVCCDSTQLCHVSRKYVIVRGIVVTVRGILHVTNSLHMTGNATCPFHMTRSTNR